MAVNRDVPVNINPEVPKEQQLSFINQNFQALSNSLNPFMVSDGTNNRVLAGKRSDGSLGFFVSQSGFDVNTATNAQLSFNSSQDVFKIASSGTTSLVAPDPFTAKQVLTATIAHGITGSIQPAFMIYTTVPNYGTAYIGINQIQMLPYTFFSYNITPLLYVFGTSDTTNLYIKIANLYDANLAGLGGTWTFKYYILQESAT